uniref:Uncharacterized protein n=1 Tax=Heligmosomoides polygyrus TaxID=6339 RepID=A0A183G4X4_HELPZ
LKKCIWTKAMARQEINAREEPLIDSEVTSLLILQRTQQERHVSLPEQQDRFLPVCPGPSRTFQPISCSPTQRVA